MDRKIVVPDEMLKAACDATGNKNNVTMETGLEAALLWFSKNPIEPTDSFLEEMLNLYFFRGQDWTYPQVFKFCTAWQRRMFLAESVDPRRAKIVEVLKQYPDRAPEIADKIMAALEEL